MVTVTSATIAGAAELDAKTRFIPARLSEQLRRFLDDKAWLENRRIMDILAQDLILEHADTLRRKGVRRNNLNGLYSEPTILA